MFVVVTFQQMIYCNSSGSLPPQNPLSITVKSVLRQTVGTVDILDLRVEN